MNQSKKPKTCSDGSSASSGHKLRTEMVVEREEKLKEQFLELGNALDPDRTKRDKVTILTDTIQVLKDLMNQVERLKAEYAKLSQESRELIQEKCKLKEEKATLTSDIEILRVRSMAPLIPLCTYPIPVGAITQGQSTFIPSSASVTEQASVQQHSLSSGASDKQDSKTKSLDEGNDHKNDDVGLELELKIHDSSER